MPETAKNLRFQHSALTVNSKPTPKSPGTRSKPGVNRRGATNTFGKSAISGFKSTWRKIDFQDYLSDSGKATESKGFFLTGVLPQSHKPTRESWKKLKDALHVAATKRFGQTSSFIWKAELQPATGTLHIHVVVFAKETHKRLQISAWFRETWCCLCQDQSRHFRRYGTKTQTLFGGTLDLLRRYLLKHPITGDQEWKFGKVWGCWNKANLPVVDPVEYHFDTDTDDNLGVLIQFLQQHQLTRNIRKVGKLSTLWKGFSIDLPPDQIKQLQRDYNIYLATLGLLQPPER